jgi:thymidylate synthase
VIKLFEGETANQVWLEAAAHLQDDQTEVLTQASRAGTTREILHAAFSIQDPLQRWVIARHPGINAAFAIAEVVWIMSGRNDAAFLTYWNPQLPKFVGNASNLHGAYGFRLRQHFGLDQLERAYLALHSSPDSRQVVLQIWDCKADLPDEEGHAADDDIPCNIMSALKLRDNKLEWLQVMRSNDLYLGTPYNFIQFTTIQEVLAGWLGAGVGSYNHISDSLHIYERDYEHARLNIVMEAQKNTDSLALPRSESERVFALLSSYFERMTNSTLQEDELKSLVGSSELPTPYRNLLLVVAAEASRRRGWSETINKFTSACTNPLLSQAWEAWMARFL